MKKFYVSPLVSVFEASVDAGFCTSGTDGSSVVLDPKYNGYYEEEA